MVLICVAAILCIAAFNGMKKGAIRMAASLVAMIITIAVTTFASPIVSEKVKNDTDMDERITQSIYENIIKDGRKYGEDDLQVIDSSTVVYKDAIQSKVDAISEYMKLPQSLSDNITESAAMKILDSAGTSAEVTIKEMAAQIFAAQIFAAQLSAIIINAICYCIVFVILYIILKVFMGVTGVISRLPVIHQADKLCGTIAGIVEGLIIVWVVFAIVTAFGNNVWASDILAQIHSSSFLEFIYDNNIIMKMIIS